MCLGLAQEWSVKANQWSYANFFSLAGSHISDAVHLAG